MDAQIDSDILTSGSQRSGRRLISRHSDCFMPATEDVGGSWSSICRFDVVAQGTHERQGKPFATRDIFRC